MKTYRKAVADAFALRDVLEYLAGRADCFTDDAEGTRERMKGSDPSEKDWYVGVIAEHEAKAAAYERLLEKLSK